MIADIFDSFRTILAVERQLEDRLGMGTLQTDTDRSGITAPEAGGTAVGAVEFEVRLIDDKIPTVKYISTISGTSPDKE